MKDGIPVGPVGVDMQNLGVPGCVPVDLLGKVITL